MKPAMSPISVRARVLGAVVASAAVAAAIPAVGQAAETGQPFGQHVSECAQMSLGERANPPAITCTHDGQVHTFANFGAMVQHMHAHHG